ncbi:MAG: hypothetical protein EOR60_02260 [Mesorhizobium sp.]|nr:MAG: hypothetical protein EOR60_02260 [Mesorhizobium sp.]
MAGALGCPDLPLEAASFEWADIAGAAPVFLAADDPADALFGASLFGAAFLSRAFFGSFFDEKMPVMLSMMDIGWPSIETDQQFRPSGIVPLLIQLHLMEQKSLGGFWWVGNQR